MSLEAKNWSVDATFCYMIDRKNRIFFRFSRDSQVKNRFVMNLPIMASLEHYLREDIRRALAQNACCTSFSERI